MIIANLSTLESLQSSHGYAPPTSSLAVFNLEQIEMPEEDALKMFQFIIAAREELENAIRLIPKDKDNSELAKSLISTLRNNLGGKFLDTVAKMAYDRQASANGTK